MAENAMMRRLVDGGSGSTGRRELVRMETSPDPRTTGAAGATPSLYPEPSPFGLDVVHEDRVVDSAALGGYKCSSIDEGVELEADVSDSTLSLCEAHVRGRVLHQMSHQYSGDSGVSGQFMSDASPRGSIVSSLFESFDSQQNDPSQSTGISDSLDSEWGPPMVPQWMATPQASSGAGAMVVVLEGGGEDTGTGGGLATLSSWEPREDYSEGFVEFREGRRASDGLMAQHVAASDEAGNEPASLAHLESYPIAGACSAEATHYERSEEERSGATAGVSPIGVHQNFFATLGKPSSTAKQFYAYHLQPKLHPSSSAERLSFTKRSIARQANFGHYCGTDHPLHPQNQFTLFGTYPKQHSLVHSASVFQPIVEDPSNGSSSVGPTSMDAGCLTHSLSLGGQYQSVYQQQGCWEDPGHVASSAGPPWQQLSSAMAACQLTDYPSGVGLVAQPLNDGGASQLPLSTTTANASATNSSNSGLWTAS